MRAEFKIFTVRVPLFVGFAACSNVLSKRYQPLEANRQITAFSFYDNRKFKRILAIPETKKRRHAENKAQAILVL